MAQIDDSTLCTSGCVRDTLWLCTLLTPVPATADGEACSVQCTKCFMDYGADLTNSGNIDDQEFAMLQCNRCVKCIHSSCLATERREAGTGPSPVSVDVRHVLCKPHYDDLVRTIKQTAAMYTPPALITRVNPVMGARFERFLPSFVELHMRAFIYNIYIHTYIFTFSLFI